MSLDEDWTPAGGTLKQGSVVSVSLSAAEKDPEHLKPTVIFAPTADEFEQQLATTKNHLLMTTLKHVQGRAYVYTRGKDGRWTRKQLDLPANQTVGIAAASKTDDRFFIGLAGFINPPSLMLGNGGRWGAEDGQGAEAAVRRQRSDRGSTGGDVEGWDQGSVLCRAP